jgi:hypothetical protein
MIMRLVKRADDYGSDDDDGYNAHYNDTHRRVVHGSRPKGSLSELGGRAMGRDAKPSGFFFKDSGHPRHSGGRP